MFSTGFSSYASPVASIGEVEWPLEFGSYSVKYYSSLWIYIPIGHVDIRMTFSEDLPPALQYERAFSPFLMREAFLQQPIVYCSVRRNKICLRACFKDTIPNQRYDDSKVIYIPKDLPLLFEPYNPLHYFQTGIEVLPYGDFKPNGSNVVEID